MENTIKCNAFDLVKEWWEKLIFQWYLFCFLRTSIKFEYVDILGGCMLNTCGKECLAAEVSHWCFLWLLWAKLAKYKVTEEHKKSRITINNLGYRNLLSLFHFWYS